jgi:steroid delta-isomerase-like uncharacterized protein
MLGVHQEQDRSFALVQRLVDAWNSHDRSRIEALYAANFEGTDTAERAPLLGRQAIGESMMRYIGGFPDFQVRCDEFVMQGDHLIFFWTAVGTHTGAIMRIPPTGRRVQAHGASFLLIENGLIRRSRTIWDGAGFLRDIGLLPEL